MSEQSASVPAPPPIDRPLYTVASVPLAADFAQKFIQVSDAPGVGAGLMYSDGIVWRGVAFSAQKKRAVTATDGSYTWVFDNPFAVGTVPKIFHGAQAPAGSTDIYNTQEDGPATNTQVKIRVTRSALTVIPLLGITLAVPLASASIGAVTISIVALQ